MKESKLLKKLKKESKQNAPDLFDEIMTSAQDQGIVKPSKAAKMSAAHASGGASSGIAVKIVSVFTALAITASAASVAGIALSSNDLGPSGPPAADLPDGSLDGNGSSSGGQIDDDQTGGGSGSGSGGGQADDSGSSGGGSGSGSGGGQADDSGSSGGVAGDTHVCNFIYDSTIPATCTQQGYDLSKCDFPGCTETKKDNYTNTIDHVYGAGTLLNGKCGQQGSVQHECVECGHKETTTGIVDHEYEEHKCIYCNMYGDLRDGHGYYQSRLHYTATLATGSTLEDIPWIQDCEIEISYISILIDRNHDIRGASFNLHMHAIQLVGYYPPAWYDFANCGIYSGKLQGWVDISDAEGGSVFEYELPEYAIVPEIELWDMAHDDYVTFTFDSEVTVNKDEGYVEFILKGEGTYVDEYGAEFKYTFVSDPIRVIYDTCSTSIYDFYGVFD